MFFSSKIKLVFSIIIAFVCISKVFLSCKTTNQSTNQPINELGKYLFFDRRLSINQTRSCGTCHNPQFAFTDGYKRSLGAFADLHQRNTQPLFNLSQLKYLTASDSTLHTPLQQMDNPLFNTHPIEMGIKGNETSILNRIKIDDNYKKLFANADLILSWENIKTAIAQFTLSIKSNNSSYDKFVKGDSNALSAAEKNGKELFFSAKTNCTSCHGGNNFATPNIVNEKGALDFYFNTGLYNIDGNGAYPFYDQGLYQHTKNKNDMGKFRIPTLRNLAYTAPYIHDGSIASLNEVLDVYINGGRKIEEGINKGDGTKNIFKHKFIKGFSLNENEKKNLLSFLLALSDSSFVKNSTYQNPYVEDETKNKN
jgi:cytochrome c peroxidase